MKYQKKYTTQSQYDGDTQETNSVSLVSDDTLYYDGTAIQTNTSSGGNIIVEEDGLYQIKDGNIYPVSHPDLSTQPSLLSYRVGKKPVYQVMIPILECTVGSSGILFKLPSNCEEILSVIGYNGTKSLHFDAYIDDSGLQWWISYKYGSIFVQHLVVTYVGHLSNNYYSGLGNEKKVLYLQTYNSLSSTPQSFSLIAPSEQIYNTLDTVVGEVLVNGNKEADLLVKGASGLLVFSASWRQISLDVLLSREYESSSTIVLTSGSIPYSTTVIIYDLR